MASPYWTDPLGQQHQYQNEANSFVNRTKRGVERDTQWMGIDPSFDPHKYQVGPTGQITEVGAAFNPLLAAAVLGGPLAVGFLPGAFGAAGAGGAAAAPGTAVPAATGAGTAAASAAAGAAATGGIGEVLKRYLLNPSNATDLAGVVTALIGATRGGGGQSSAEAQRLNQITEQRMQRVDPLHQAVTQLAWNRLPISARQGITAPTYQPLK